MLKLNVHVKDAPDVQAQARVRLWNWFVFREFGLYGDEVYVDFLFGFPPAGSLRMTSRIAKFDPSRREVTTRSGRLYELGGACCKSEVWMPILEAAGRFHEQHDFQDVTAEYAKKMSKMTH